MLVFDDVEALHTTVLSSHLACGLYTIFYNQQSTPNAPVLLEKALFGHLMLWFIDVDALSDAISSSNLACGLHIILYNH